MRRLNMGQKINHIACAAIVAGFASTAAFGEEAERLSEAGAELAPASVASGAASLTREIDAAGDAIEATHVVAQAASTNRTVQRDPNGFWAPWDGDPESLIDAGFRAVDGRVTYKIFDQDMSNVLFPVRVVLIYRAGETLKFGEFTVEAGE